MYHTSNFQIHILRGLHDNQIDFIGFEDSRSIAAFGGYRQEFEFSLFSVKNAANRLEFAEVQ